MSGGIVVPPGYHLAPDYEEPGVYALSRLTEVAKIQRTPSGHIVYADGRPGQFESVAELLGVDPT